MDKKSYESNLVTFLWRYYAPIEVTLLFTEHLPCAKLFTYTLNLTTRTKKVPLSLLYGLVNGDIEIVGTQTNSNLISKPLLFFFIALPTDSYRTMGKEIIVF